LTKILQDKDKYKKFQVLLKKMEKQLKNEKINPELEMIRKMISRFLVG